MTDSSTEKPSSNVGHPGVSGAKFAGQCGSCLSREEDGTCRHLWDSAFSLKEIEAIRDGVLKCPLHSPSSRGVAPKHHL